MKKFLTQEESNISSLWRKNNNFKNSTLPVEFSIIMPPPNVTGNLHLGHAWDSYIQDVFIRHKHLLGINSTWYPGMDHAGIATQSKVEALIFKEENLTRKELGRQEFTKRVLEWKERFAKNIHEQWNKLGLLLDEDKESFTLDQDVNDLVVKTFISLYEKGLIYRDKKIINWDIKLNTAISDIEVVYKKSKSNLYNIKYKLEDSNETLIISTTRPETIFGDTAIFVNDQDERYQNLIGEFVINPLNNSKIKILADEYVEKDFGTGVMKATPAHDFNDYELGKKHNLEFINIMNSDGTMNEKTMFCEGLSREECRIKTIEFLESNNALESTDEITNQVSYSERSDSIIEPLISTQWFLKTSEIAKKIIEEKDNFNIEFYPKRFNNDLWRWMENMGDWCISRQLWWGHQIPVWYKKDDKKVIKVTDEEQDKSVWVRDEDVLDTWFSSALWPIHFNQKFDNDDKEFLSINMITGYDIIFFWISKMILLSYEEKGKYPFKNVYIHGLVRDKQGRKMSKSLDNGINPIEVIDEYGSDTLRISLMSNSKPGNDLKFDIEKLQSSQDILIKLNNLNKFISQYKPTDLNYKDDLLSNFDKWIFNQLNDLNKDIAKLIDTGNFTVLYKEIYEFIFNDFASVYIENFKSSVSENSVNFLYEIWRKILITLHPFIPFLTEDIYQSNKSMFDKESILQERNVSSSNFKIEKEFMNVLNLIRFGRKYKSMYAIPPKNNIKLVSYFPISLSKDLVLELKQNEKIDFEVVDLEKTSENFVGIEIERIADEVNIFLIADLNNEDNNNKTLSELLGNLREKIDFEFNRSSKIIANDKFMEKASPDKKAEEVAKFDYYKDLKNFLDEKI